MSSQSLVKFVSNLTSLFSVVVIAGAATLSFWFVAQYAVTLEQNRGLVILMAYIALIAGYYGIAPLSESIQNKVDWILSKIFVSQAEECPAQPEPEPEPESEPVEIVSPEVQVEVLAPNAPALNVGYLAAPVLSKVDIEILITKHDAASDPDLPSHLFPGCGSDGAGFAVQGPHIPSYIDIDKRLYRWDFDCCLVDYSEETGIGYFRMVDADAPAQGTLISLKHLD